LMAVPELGARCRLGFSGPLVGYQRASNQLQPGRRGACLVI